MTDQWWLEAPEANQGQSSSAPANWWEEAPLAQEAPKAAPLASFKSATPREASALGQMASVAAPQEAKPNYADLLPKGYSGNTPQLRTMSNFLGLMPHLRAAELARERGEGSFLWNLFNAGTPQHEAERRALQEGYNREYEAAPDYAKVMQNIGLPSGPMVQLSKALTSSARPLASGAALGGALGGVGGYFEPVEPSMGDYGTRALSAAEGVPGGALFGGALGKFGHVVGHGVNDFIRGVNEGRAPRVSTPEEFADFLNGLPEAPKPSSPAGGAAIPEAPQAAPKASPEQRQAEARENLAKFGYDWNNEQPAKPDVFGTSPRKDLYPDGVVPEAPTYAQIAEALANAKEMRRQQERASATPDREKFGEDIHQLEKAARDNPIDFVKQYLPKGVSDAGQQADLFENKKVEIQPNRPNSASVGEGASDQSGRLATQKPAWVAPAFNEALPSTSSSTSQVSSGAAPNVWVPSSADFGVGQTSRDTAQSPKTAPIAPASPTLDFSDLIPKEAAPAPQSAPQAAETGKPAALLGEEAGKPAGEPGAAIGRVAPEAQLEAIIQTQRIARPTKKPPMSLIGFLRANGGIKPSGELSAMDVQSRIKGLINKRGMSHDEALQLLIDKGYLPYSDPEQQSPYALADFYDLIDRAVRGERIMPRGFEHNPVIEAEKAKALGKQQQMEVDAQAALKQLDAEHGTDHAAEFDRMPRVWRDELSSRIASGENPDDVLEEMYIREYNDTSSTEPHVRQAAHLDIPFGDENEAHPGTATRGSGEPAAAGRTPEQPGRTGEVIERGARAGELGEAQAGTEQRPAPEPARELPRISREEAARNYPLELGEDVKPPLKGKRGRYPELSEVPTEEKGGKPAEYDFLHHANQNLIPVQFDFGGKRRIGTVHRLGPVSESPGAAMRVHLYQTGGEVGEGKNGVRQLKEGEGRWGHFNLEPTGVIPGEQGKRGATVDPEKQITNLDYAPLGTPVVIPKNAHNVQSGIKVIHTQIPYGEDEVHGGKMFAMKADPDARQHAVSQVSAGRKVSVPKQVLAASHEALQPYLHAIPEGMHVGALKSLHPGELPGEIVATFQHPDGSSFHFSVDSDTVFGARAFVDHDIGALVSFRLGSLAPGGEKGVAGRSGKEDVSASARTLRAEISHELVHAVWKNLPVGVKKGLVGHSDSLGIMGRQWGDYLKTIGDPSWEYAEPGTVRDVYEEKYADFPDRLYKDAMEQEAASHVMELYQHGALSDKDIAPVKHILDGILKGEYSGRGKAQKEVAPQAAAVAQDQTQTPAFKKWFGGSKVVDEKNGEPLVMYRGSQHENAEAYGKGGMIFLTPKRDFAENYANGGGKVFDLYVKSDHPFDASRGEGYQLWKEFNKEHPVYGAKGTSRGSLPYWTAERELKKWLDARGVKYDGIYFGENDGSYSLAVKSPQQIKATNNRGTFNPEDPRITYAMAGSRGAENLAKADRPAALIPRAQYTPPQTPTSKLAQALVRRGKQPSASDLAKALAR